MLSRNLSSLLVLALIGAAAPLRADEAFELELVGRLGKVASVREARLLVEALGEIGSERALRALGELLERRGPAHQEALEVLWLSGNPVSYPYLLDLAAQASPQDRLSLDAVRVVALIPGDRTVRLLQRLSGDWSVPVQEAAHRALSLRARAGLPTSTEIKPVPLNVVILPPASAQPVSEGAPGEGEPADPRRRREEAPQHPDRAVRASDLE